MTVDNHSTTLIGWREWVRLHQAKMPWVKAKIDTGAQTSALHAFDVAEFERDGAPWVRFGVVPWQANNNDASVVELPLHGRRTVKSSNGMTEQRPVVLLEVELAGKRVTAEFTLTNRDEMGFRMLIGREALQQGFVVDCSASYLGTKPRKVIRKKNRTETTEPPAHTAHSASLAETRTSVKFTTFPPEVIPQFIAEQDFVVAPEIQKTLIERVKYGDLGYVGSAAQLAEAFVEFSRDRWGFDFPAEWLTTVTDVNTGIYEVMRLVLPAHGGKIALNTPGYPSFFGVLNDLNAEAVEVPLTDAGRLDLDAIEAVFQSGVDAFLLCSPHNPHGTVHTAAELTAFAKLAKQYGVFVFTDEIHAPLTYPGVTFTPFGEVAAATGVLAVTACSGSKGWNIPGVKCALLSATGDQSHELLQRLPEAVASRVSILGLHANITAFRDARDWLDTTTAKIADNAELFRELMAEAFPEAKLSRPEAGFLLWADLRDCGFGDNPFETILTRGKVAFGNGASFGAGGAGHVRVNLACEPEVLREVVRRMQQIAAAGANAEPSV